MAICKNHEKYLACIECNPKYIKKVLLQGKISCIELFLKYKYAYYVKARSLISDDEYTAFEDNCKITHTDCQELWFMVGYSEELANKYKQMIKEWKKENDLD